MKPPTTRFLACMCEHKLQASTRTSFVGFTPPIQCQWFHSSCELEAGATRDLKKGKTESRTSVSFFPVTFTKEGLNCLCRCGNNPKEFQYTMHHLVSGLGWLRRCAGDRPRNAVGVLHAQESLTDTWSHYNLGQRQ